MFVGEGPRAHLSRLAECIRWSYGAGILLRLGNIARLELNYCIPMGVQSGDRYINNQSVTEFHYFYLYYLYYLHFFILYLSITI